jgi:hypothetical protein
MEVGFMDWATVLNILGGISLVIPVVFGLALLVWQ